ncbi:hypothetical protein [Moorena sp. SIO4G3]|uniref:hypothetical protein n=1 Tax=Moorena sp. SIO4G3 TaxID=2607821 RepID=UPI00142B56B1|nr:hypothetical protein [Moorena sp. SIO4G3]NEO79254.1 hypothetical protein [Moorena sp. SIO4G3]
MTLVPPKVGGLGGQNSVSKNLGDILLEQFVTLEAANRDLRLERTAKRLSGEEVLPGFLLDLHRVWD